MQEVKTNWGKTLTVTAAADRQAAAVRLRIQPKAIGIKEV